MNHVVYDTNIASLALRGRMPAALGARLFGAVEVLAFVTVGELVKDGPSCVLGGSASVALWTRGWASGR